VRVLVVDDEPAIRLALLEIVEAAGHTAREAPDGATALASLDGQSADLVLADLRMPGIDGLELLDRIKEKHPDKLFVLITALGDERTAVRALKSGAYDYVPKPFDNEEIRSILKRAWEVLSLRAENRRLREEMSTEYRGMIGDSPAMRETTAFIKRVGPTDVTVLITGESGTGKELAARAIHAESPRREKPFIPLNCSALPGELIESELFGHVRGAFTGADRDHDGLFAAAHAGTLFLDEVGDLAPAAQAKLLRALEEGCVTPVGSTSSRPVDVRLLAATHRPLASMVDDGTFRQDLMFRLRVVELPLPPLRERRQDISVLSLHFIAELAQRHGRPPHPLSDQAKRVLMAYDWPGNVRELRNVLERAVLLSDTEMIEVADLPESLTTSKGSLRPVDAAIADYPYHEARDRALTAFERSFLGAALERHGGNVSATARALGLHRQSLQKMMRRLDLTR
jgi:DNA-binding NtrC family response regulator